MTAPSIGSMCTGYGGLDMAVQAVLGGEVAWFAENDPDASRVLAHHWPHVPNLGDLTAVDWSAVEPVDVVCAGYPCQPFSAAGKRRGVEDERHIWPYIAAALRVLRPCLVVLENVRGHLGRGFDAVLGDLAALGFDARWQVVRASDVGAPHQRERLFVLATAADAAHLGHERGRSAWDGRTGPAHGGVPAADPGRPGLEVRPVEHHGPERPAAERSRRELALSDAQRDGRNEGRPEPARQLGGPDASLGRAEAPADTDRDGFARRTQRHRESEAGIEAPCRDDADGRVLDWGPYEPAIRRWEHATGRAAPSPTEPGRTGPRLSPAFVEWLMGLPAGHVTAVPGISRNAMLRILGNGVVPQQTAAALALLLDRAEAAA